VQGLSGIVAISAGWWHSLALQGDGTVWAWGGNEAGELGDGTITRRFAPVQVQGLVAPVAIAAGAAQSLAVLRGGTAMAWGSNSHGELGDGTTTDRLIPTAVPGLGGVTAIAGGLYHTVAATNAQPLLNFQTGVGTVGQRDSALWVQGNWIYVASEAWVTAVALSLQRPYIINQNAAWHSPIPGGHYVSPSSTGSGARGGYEYFVEFNRPVGPGTTTLDLQWQADDAALPNINGIYVPNMYASYFKAEHEVRDISALVQPGVNRLSFFVCNVSGPTALDCKVLITFQPSPTGQITVETTSGAPGALVPLRATLTADGQPQTGKTVAFTVGGQVMGSDQTDLTGKATLEIGVPDTLGAGDVEVRAAFAGDAGCGATTGTGALTILKGDTRPYVVVRSGLITDSVRLKAWLKRLTDNAWLVGRTVEFAIDGAAVGTGTVGADGMAYLDWIITAGPSERTITASYAGEAVYNPSTGSAPLLALTTNTKLYVPDRTAAIYDYTVLKAWLYKNPGNVPIGGKPLAFTVGGTDLGKATTISTGQAQIYYTIPVASGAGTRPIYVTWSGDAGYMPSASSAVLNALYARTYLWTGDRTPLRGEAIFVKALLRCLPSYAPVMGLPVSFQIDGTGIGSAPTAVTGWAGVNWTVPESMTGTHQIKADAPGDATFAPASATATLTPKAMVPTYLWTGDRTLRPGQVLTIVSLLRRTSDYAPLSGRTVDAAIDGTSVGSGVTAVDGWSQVSWTMPVNMTGQHVIKVSYAGETLYQPSTGTAKLAPYPDIVVNGSFEFGVNPPNIDGRSLSAGSTDLAGWSIVKEQIDWLGPTRWIASDGSRCLDMNGTPGVGAIQQVLPTVAGQDYVLKFDLAAEPDLGPRTSWIRVQVGSLTHDFSAVTTSSNTPSNMGWTTQTLTFRATASTTALTFTSLDTTFTDTGPNLDNVRVNAY
jgi:choice-of-anchor C domain-containing protein